MITTKHLLCIAILMAFLSACSNTSDFAETSAASFENAAIMTKPAETELETEPIASVTEETERSDEPIEIRSNNEYEYYVYDDHIKIWEYLGDDSKVIIPAEIDGLPVTVIEYYAFGHKDTLTYVELPNNLIKIGESAFQFCRNLKSVLIPESVTEISNEAFSFCESLENISIPKNVTKIGFAAFDNSGLKEIDFADGIEEIGGEAFWNCEKIEQVILPNTVKIIGEAAFADCTSL